MKKLTALLIMVLSLEVYAQKSNTRSQDSFPKINKKLLIKDNKKLKDDMNKDLKKCDTLLFKKKPNKEEQSEIKKCLSELK